MNPSSSFLLFLTAATSQNQGTERTVQDMHHKGGKDQPQERLLDFRDLEFRGAWKVSEYYFRMLRPPKKVIEIRS